MTTITDEDRQLAELRIHHIGGGKVLVAGPYGARPINARKAHDCDFCDRSGGGDEESWLSSRFYTNLMKLHERPYLAPSLEAFLRDPPEIILDAACAIQRGDDYIGAGGWGVQSHYCFRCARAGLVPDTWVFDEDDEPVTKIRDAESRVMREAINQIWPLSH